MLLEWWNYWIRNYNQDSKYWNLHDFCWVFCESNLRKLAGNWIDVATIQLHSSILHHHVPRFVNVQFSPPLRTWRTNETTLPTFAEKWDSRCIDFPGNYWKSTRNYGFYMFLLPITRYRGFLMICLLNQFREIEMVPCFHFQTPSLVGPRSCTFCGHLGWVKPLLDDAVPVVSGYTMIWLWVKTLVPGT